MITFNFYFILLADREFLENSHFYCKSTYTYQISRICLTKETKNTFCHYVINLFLHIDTTIVDVPLKEI